MPALELGFSPCPNDTFMFHALVHGLVTVAGASFRPVLADIEELNRRALGPDPLPVTKLSVAAMAAAGDRYRILPAGAALGRGCGPLVVARGDGPAGLDGLAGRRVAIPGRHTTAHLLLRAFAPACDAVELRFDRIPAAVAAGELAAGVIIHESRFTYAEHGLCAIADLGECWEADTGLPLPLGVIAARRDLDHRLADDVAAGIAASVRAAFDRPERPRAWMLANAQELAPEVCERHVALYVNDFSVDLGTEGRAAIDALIARARGGGAPVW